MNLLDQVEQGLSVKRIGIEEFAESEEYCDRPLYPRQKVLLKLIFLEELSGKEEDVLDHWIRGGRNGTEITISPNIRERVQYLRDNGYPHFHQILLNGGRRSSKGYLTALAMGKVMWDCLQLQDPGRHYKVDPKKEIYFTCVAGSLDQAKEFQFGDLSNTIEGCRAMEPHLVKSLETELRIATATDIRAKQRFALQGNRIQKDIARIRGKALPANAGTLRGSATMALCLDEVAHMIPGEAKASADQVYGAATPALEQFGADGMIFLNSSPYTKVGLFYEEYALAMRTYDPDRLPGSGLFEDLDDEEINGNPLTFAFQFPSWALYEGYQEDKRFTRAVMCSPEWDPEEKDEEGNNLWSSEDQRAILKARIKESSNPDKFKVENRAKFAEVVDAYLQPEMVDRMYQGIPRGAKLVVVGDREEIVEEFTRLSTDEGGISASNVLRYKAHVDPSSTTAGFGFALAHIEEINDDPHVVFDVIKRWQPQHFPGKVIKWEPILQWLVRIIDIFRPFEITFDQHESMEPIQDLEERLRVRNIPTRVYEKYATNELNWKRWEVFKTSLYQGLVHAPYDQEDVKWSNLELKFLVEKRTGGKFPRVDRQEIGPVKTKDMADCIAECTHSLIGNMMINRTRDRLANSSMVGGAQGGFGIGKDERVTKGMGMTGNLADYYQGFGRRTGEQRTPARQIEIPKRGRVGRGRSGPIRRNPARGL